MKTSYFEKLNEQGQTSSKSAKMNLLSITINMIKTRLILKKVFIHLFSFSLIFLVASSCNGKDEPIPEKEDISLSKTELQFEKQDESVKTITVNTEELFHLDKQPDWLELEIDQRLKTIKINTKPNYSKQTREVLLKVFDGNSESYLKITQRGEEEEKEPYSFKYFPNSSVSGYTTTEVDGKWTYHFKAGSFFINQKIKDDIYLGNTLNYKLASLDKLQTFEDYIFNDITVFSEIINGKFYLETWETPSMAQMNNLAEQIINANPNQNLYFSTGSPVIFRSYKYLHFLSMANLGFGIDEILNESNSSDMSMNKDIGLIYSYNQTLFSLTIDYSLLDRSGITEETDFITADNLSYISNVSYGRTAFLVVESNGSEQDAKALIGKASRKEALTESEVSLINSMDINYLYFSPDGVLLKDESADNIEKIINYVEVKNNNIIPLRFTVSDYVNSGMTEIEYTITPLL